jgi:hypothetical protein
MRRSDQGDERHPKDDGGEVSLKKGVIAKKILVTTGCAASLCACDDIWHQIPEGGTRIVHRGSIDCGGC